MPKQTKKNVDSISLPSPPPPSSSCLLLKLPDELLLSIFKYVEVEARPNLVRSCRKFHGLRSSLYKEKVRARSGQKMYICNCPYCNKVMTVPLVPPISKKKHRCKLIKRPVYNNTVYCSFVCVTGQHFLDVWHNNKKD